MTVGRRTLMTLLASLFAFFGPNNDANAQVTTGSISGIVTNTQQQPVPGASVIAIHEPSGTSYEATTRADGRFSIPNMRVGDRYTVQVVYVGTGTAFEPQTQENVTVNLGVSTDLQFVVRPIAVQETVTVTAETDPVFASSRTGAATALSREDLASLPQISGRLETMTRLTPQSSGNMNFMGQDNRLNNITVDGSFFNNSFGIGNTPGERTNVAPISLDAIEQIQISVAPYDVRQGNFVGAAVNTVTRSGTNQLRGSFIHQFRDEGMVGTNARDLPFNPGTFDYRNTGGWISGPIFKDKLFYFVNYEDEGTIAPGTTFRANLGGEAVAGGTTRVLASDLGNLSSFLGSRFNYDTGPFQQYDHETPANRFLPKFDYNINNANKVSFRYTHLDSFTDVLVSDSSSLGFGNRRTRTDALNFQNSNYQIVENIRSGVGEWNAVLGRSMANQLIIGYTYQDESRTSRGDFFPFVDILKDGLTYTSFGFEPFTPNNELRYKTFQLQNNFTKFGEKHAWTLGAAFQRYESENVFFPGKQSAYVYNSLEDFYTDANGYLANPNRTTSPVTLRRFQVRYLNVPGVDKPVQPLEVFYAGGYAQDDWSLRNNLKLTVGVRFDVPSFGETGYANANADALTFRDENGNPVQYSTANLPDPKFLWSPRVGFNWDVANNQRTQVRGGTGIFTGPPPYVWISNQIGNTGVLTGFTSVDNTTAFPFNPDPDRYKPTTPPTGAPAATYELALTDPGFKFPQLWRSNLAVDRRLFGGWTGTAEFIYNRDVNQVYYINANLPAPQSAFTGPDARPRWTSNRIHQHVSNAIVLKNQNEGSSWNMAGSLTKTFRTGFSFKGAYSYGESKNTIDPSTIAFGSWNNNPHPGDPNNPGIAFSNASPGHRLIFAGTYTKEYFRFGATTVSAFWESRQNNTNYTFSGDLNGDGGTSNDLIYVPRNTSEMNFQEFSSGGRTFTAAQQAAAWDAYIQQESYLSERRGQYAERGAVFLPMVSRVDVSIAQELFTNIRGRRNSVQIRADILNFGNLLNKNWGVGQRLVTIQPLIVPTTAQGGPVDAQGRAQYRLRVINNELVTTPLEYAAGIGDVYRFQISLRYSFN